MVKFLIIRFSSIGDIVLTTPVIRCMKQQIDDSVIHFVTKKQFLPVVINNPHIDKIHVLDNNFQQLQKTLKEESFDYIIDLHNNIRTLRIKNALRRMSFTFKKINFKKWLIVNFKINKLPEIHIVDRYFNTLKLFDVKNDNKGLEYFLNEDDVADYSIFAERIPVNFIAFVIGAKHYTKQLPAEKIISLLNKIEHPVVILGGREDAGKGKVIEKNCKSHVFNACGKLKLNQSAAVIRDSQLVITHDTGLMHIAAAFRKKIISIWGNTIPKFGMYPYQPDNDSLILEVKGLKCRPCTKIGYKKCPKKHFDCMNKIDEQQIIKHVNIIFNKINS